MRKSGVLTTALGMLVLLPLACDESNSGISTCATIPAAYTALIEANRGCSTVADCTVVGGPKDLSCDGVEVLGAESGDAVNVAVAAEALRLIADYGSEACAGAGFEHTAVIDAGPAVNLRCEGWVCKADGTTCNDVPDVGNDPDTTAE